MSSQYVDFALFLVANLYNLLMVFIFLSRTTRYSGIERILGIIAVIMAFPLIGGAVINALLGRDGWFIFLPLPLVVYLAVEWLLDYYLKLDFRNSNLLWPYLLLYYLGLMAMIGYNFLAGNVYGFITLLTYFLNLFATWYSYSKVGHQAKPK